MSKPVGASSLLAHAAIQSSLVLPGYSNLACGMVCCDGSFMVRVAFGTSFLDVGSRWLGPVHDHASRWLSPTCPDLYIPPFFPSFHCPDHIKVSVSRFLSFGCSGSRTARLRALFRFATVRPWRQYVSLCLGGT